MDRIKSIEYVRTDLYFDLNVPGEQHYLADGIWSHNTGKTFALIRRSDWLARKYPGCRILWVRETRESLSQSVCAIFEEYVLWPGHEILKTGGKVNQRPFYRYPNGSVIVLAGLDTPERIMSTQYDFICVFEATNPHVTSKAWSLLTTRNRGQHIPNPECRYPDGVLPDGRKVAAALADREFPYGEDEDGKPLFWRQMVADCNPESEEHWLWRRFQDGHMTRLRSIHADNPMVDRAYLQRLDSLPGVYRDRLFLGKWVRVEGAIWGTYASKRHLISLEFEFDAMTGRRFVHVPEWQDDEGQTARFAVTGVVAGLDWGFSSPGALEVLAYCQGGYRFQLAEVYAVEKGIEWWAERAVSLVDEFKIEVIRCDHDPDNIRALNRALGPRKGREKGGIAQQANKRRNRKGSADFGGLDVVREGFRTNRLFLNRYALRGRDPLLDAQHLPCGVAEEIPNYAFDMDKKTGERLEAPPDNAVDHGCDALRYAEMDIADRSPRPDAQVRFIAPPGVIAYEVGTPAERARLRQLAKRRDRYSLH